MLELLRISNYAIIDDLEVEFGPGLTAITGETGAGKSILIGALKLALGERATADAIRTGANRASVEAVFRIENPSVWNWLQESGLADDASLEERVVLRREITASGSRTYINNRTSTAAQLREIANRLIDMHGQNEHMTLLEPSVQLRQLDEFGGDAVIIQDYRDAHRTYRECVAAVARLQADSGDSMRRKAFLEFQIEEISGAGLVVGEDEQLAVEKKRLLNAEKLRMACEGVIQALYESDGPPPAASLLAASIRTLGEIGTMDPSQSGLAGEAEAIRFSVEDLASRIRDYADSVSADPARLSVVEDRLDAIRTLKKKYGATIEEVLEAGEKMAAEVAAIENHDSDLAAADAALVKSAGELLAAARALSAARGKTAAVFQKRVEAEIRELELPRAVFRVELTSSDNIEGCHATGTDAVEFAITLNPGEEPRPLRKVASGGEISRIMLAIETVLAARLEVPTLIFDEIDIGISGEAALRVGGKLRKLGDCRQVICITHLPQVAAQAGRHLLVRKTLGKDRTTVRVEEVAGPERVDTLAEMLGGREPDVTARKYAGQLLKRK